MRDTLYYMLLNIEKLSPVLLLGDAARFFRERYETKGEILSYIPKETPFKNRYNVFEVCSFLSNTEALEDKTPKIILADDTNISYEILSKVKCLSNEIKLKSILINGKEDRIVNLVYPDRTLSVEIEGELLNDMPAAIEAKVFDSESVLLAKFAPVLFKTVVSKTTKGSFKLKETITLPDNMTNGEYRLQLEVTHPNVQYLAVIPNAVKLVLSDYITPTGNSLMYTQNGLLLLQ